MPSLAIGRKGIADLAVATRWAEGARQCPPEAEPWRPSTDDLKVVIKMTYDSAPGPDGIPFSMWKGVGELGASVLTDCPQDLVQDGATGSGNSTGRATTG